MTLKQARAILSPLGITLKKTDGEYRVAFVSTPASRAVCEASAYYTNDIQDAVDTGVYMRRTVDMLESLGIADKVNLPGNR